MRRDHTLQRLPTVPRTGEPATLSARLNWLRAGVLGANDGIVSVAALVLGVAGASTNSTAILTAGLAGLVAGAFSMATGEYVSVSTQRDTERALLDEERAELRHIPAAALDELAGLYEAKGISTDLARAVAVQLSERDPLRAHADVELGIDPNRLTSPRHAAFASFVAFIAGALLPLLAITLPPEAVRVPACFLTVVIALIVTGSVSAGLGRTGTFRTALRVVVGGALAMGVTYGVGTLIGVSI